MQAADATLTRSTGPAFIERNGARSSIKEGDAIYESDLIITGDQTTIDISFRDGTKSRIGPDSEMRLVDFEFAPGEEASFVVNLTQGAMRTVTGEIVKLNPEAFEVVTPRATVGIRGTEFLTEVKGDSENHVVLYISGESVMLVDGADGTRQSFDKPLQGTSIDSNGTMKVQSFSMNEIQSLINSIAPSLGGNIPTNASEQGNWNDAGHLTHASSGTIASGISVDIVYDNVETLKAVLQVLQEKSGIVVNSVSPSNDSVELLTDTSILNNTFQESVLENILASDNGIFTDLSSNLFNNDHNSLSSHKDKGHSNNANENDNDLGFDNGSNDAPVYKVFDNLNDTFKTGSGNDIITIMNSVNSSGTLQAGDGNNVIVVGNNNNGTINTGKGDDYIKVGDNVNSSGSISSGAGNDLIIVGDHIHGRVDGGAGTDVVIQYSANVDTTKLTNVEAIIYGNGADSVFQTRNHLEDNGVIIGNNGSVSLDDTKWTFDAANNYYTLNSASDVYLQLLS